MKRFGTTSDGLEVHAVTIGTGPMRATILTHGARLHDLRLEGVGHSLTLGAGDLAGYEGDLAYFGPIIGPVVNRLSHARAPLGDGVLELQPNTPEGHILHSGPAGLHGRVWDIADHGPEHCTLAITLEDGACGLPGERRFTARFAVEDRTLRLNLLGASDALTLVNLANHSYWNLAGTPGWAGHRLQIAADRYLPATAEVIPTGEIAPVGGTDLDFRALRDLAPAAPALDTNFCLSDGPEALRDIAVLEGGGLRMTMASTEPGLQVYDGRSPARPGRQQYEGIALEAQHWPDAPNHAGFPSIALAPSETYAQTTTWTFDPV